MSDEYEIADTDYLGEYPDAIRERNTSYFAAADDIISGGRTLLAKILKGSRDKNKDIQELFRIEPYKPELLECWECGERFIWEIEEQKFFKSKGFVPPKRCPSCREKKWFREMGIDSDEE